MAKDIDSYLSELQAALAAAGADPALVQDALFDAEEYLRTEMATAEERAAATAAGAAGPLGIADVFAGVADGYGTPEEVAAAYVGAVLAAAPAARAEAPRVPGGPAEAPSWEPVPEQAPAPPYGQERAAEQLPPYRQGPYYGPLPPGVRAGMAGAAAMSTPPGAWRQVFGVFADPAVYKAMAYMILSLATGITYFTIVVTGVSTAGGMLVLIVGLPLLLLVLGIVRAMALFEGRLVEGLLGTRMPRRERAAPPNANVLERMWFWVKDGRTWASMVYMILMLPLGIVYFTVTVTGLAAGIGLITSIAWGWFGDREFIYEGVAYHWWFPAWGIPLAVIGGVMVLVGTMHLIRWMGRGHAAFAKSMLVRLGR